MKRLSAAVLVFAVVLVAAGCSSSVDNPPDVTPTNPATGSLPGSGTVAPTTPAATAALYQPAQGIFPFPNDLYFSGTTDGTINIQPANGLIPNQAGLNALDGWSTTSPMRVRFGGALDPTSFNAASVRVYEVTVSNTNKAVAGFTRPLAYGTEYTAGLAVDTGVGPTILEIRPLVPLKPSSGTTANAVGYLVLITNGVRMASGAAATPDTDYATIKAKLGNGPTYSATPCASLPNAPMQGACGFTASHLTVANATGVTTPSVVVSFHFTALATRDTLLALGATITAAPPGAIVVSPPPGTPLNQFNSNFPPNANVRSGTVTVPYYSYIPTAQAPGGISTDSQVLRSSWQAAVAVGGERNLTRFNPLPQGTTKAIPLLVSVPLSAKPAAGYPVVIFEHGITRDRTDSLALAGAMAQAGWAVAAVDLPLHGITLTTHPLYQATNEQTFNLDLIVNNSGASGPDGVIDPTGTHFINLTNALASRDNLRQGVVNLLALTRALPTLDLDGNPATVDIDAANIAFVGQSLGSIVGISYGAVLPNPATTTRNMTFSVPGGGVAQLLRESPTFGPRINAGLAQQGLLPGTSLYEQYFRDVQNIVDAGDPLNFVALTAQQRTIYIQQMVGNSAVAPVVPPDQVIPNSATQRLITAITAAGVALPRVVPGQRVAGDGYVNFIAGDHGSLLNPGTGNPPPGLAVTGEMQAQAVIFTAGNPLLPVTAGTIVPGTRAAGTVQP